MSHHLKAFVFGAVGFWAVVALPALRLGGSPAFTFSLVALGLCAIPTVALLLWRDRARNSSPSERLLLLLGGTGLRMAVVLGGGVTLYWSAPYFQQTSFWVWLLVFYLYLLGLEIYLILAEQREEARLK